jgi:uncharacterized membrane protein YfcA
VDPHLLIAIVLSALIGVSLGLLGGGGSILAVPLLVYVAQIDVRTAIGMSLAVVGATSLGGAAVHARGGRVDLKAALLFGGAGMVAAPIGAQVTHMVPPRALLVLFATLMIVVGALMLRARRPPSTSTPPPPRRLRVVGAGLGVGLLTGFLGVGGGFLIVPALTLFAGLPIRTAIGTSLLVIALNAAAGLAGHIRHGGLPLELTLAFSAAAVVGVVFGVKLSAGLAPVQLRRAFAAFVVLIGLSLLVTNLLPTGE